MIVLATNNYIVIIIASYIFFVLHINKIENCKIGFTKLLQVLKFSIELNNVMPAFWGALRHKIIFIPSLV